MRKIKFDKETITQIEAYINSGHTLKETCNRFTIKLDTLKRVMRENNIQAYFKTTVNNKQISAETVDLVCNLFECTDTSLNDIKKQAKLRYYELQEILNSYYTEEYQNNRKSHLYSISKKGINNPMLNKTKELHHNYKGIIDDGNGYLMCLKPDWYTGRKNSKYVFYHSIVMCEHLGLTEIPKGCVIHHIDGNKHNNDINNLALVTAGGHCKIHSIQTKLCKVQRLSKNGVGIDNDNINIETPDNN